MHLINTLTNYKQETAVTLPMPMGLDFEKKNHFDNVGIFIIVMITSITLIG